jgi:hypothetical protein
MLEDVGDAESSRQLFDPAFDELQIRRVSQVQGIETIGFGTGYVARSGSAFGVGVLVMADQRLPVGITGSLD